MKLSVVILSYNTQEFLKSCLTSIFNNVKGIGFEVVVFDNASIDESVKMVKQHFKQAKLIVSKKNLGFAKGVNTAVMSAKGDYLLFLNSDTTMKDESAAEMVTFLDSNSDVAAVGGTLENIDGTTSESYGTFFNLFSVFRMLFLKRKQAVLRKASEVDWVSGGFMLIRRSEFERVGGFDEHFFMYLEDMELCFRLKQYGRKVFFLPTAKVLHAGQGSSNRSFAILHIYRGLLYFYQKHKPAWQYTSVKTMLQIKAGIGIIVGSLTGNLYLRNTYSQAIKFQV